MSDEIIEQTDFKNTEPIQGEPNHPFGIDPLTPEEEKELTEDKRREEADSRDADIANGWSPE